MKNPLVLFLALSSGFAPTVLLAATAASPTVRLSPLTVQVRAGEHITIVAASTAIVAPANLVWSVVSTAPSPGTVTQAGVYTAPATVPVPNTVAIVATDSADAKTFGSATVTVLSPLPSITSLSATSVNTGLPFTLEITGTNFLPATQVLFDGTPVASTVVSGGLQVTSKTSAAAGAKIAVTVANPGPAASSAAKTVSVLAPVQVQVTPDLAIVRVGKPQQFYAKVLNSPDSIVTWQADAGSIDAKGMYTAPASLPSPATVTVTAISHADSTARASATVTLESTVPVLTSLGPSNINTGLAYTVNIIGSAFLNTSAVLFDGVAVPSTFVSATNLRVSGTSTLAAGKTISVTVANPGPNAVSGARTLTVLPPVQVQLTPDKRTLRVGQTLQFTAKVLNNSDQVVTWQATAGTLDDKGFYLSPALLPTTPVVTVTATSHADSTAKASVTLTLENALPVITSVTPNPVLTGTSTLTLDGTGFAEGAIVSFGGITLNTTFVSDTRLTATGVIEMPLGRVAALNVINPNPGTSMSATLAIPVRVAVEKVPYADAVRFLEMATWGPTPASVAHLQDIGRDAWIEEQLALPASAWPDPNDPTEGVGRLQDAFFTNALTGPDQLRQRLAFALSHILVASSVKDMHFAQMVSYQRVLANDAFGDFRTLLTDITLNPAMGFFLDMVNNDKANPVKNTVANENYAREVMQLFTIGLNQLDPLTGAVANATPEYDQSTVTQMAKVFTGWTYAPEPGFASHWLNAEYNFLPMVPFEEHHDTTQKIINLPGACTIPAGGTAAGDLKQALDCLAKQTNVAPFIAYRLIQSLVTSNPSPAYKGRVAAVFNTSHGDLKAIVTAILTDSEATAAGTVKLREPVLYATTLLRALNATVTNTATGVRNQTNAMGQDVLDAPSVFSYFSPSFKVAVPDFPTPGAVSVPTAPEFQILNAETAFARINFAFQAALNQLSGNIRVDFSNLQALAANPAVLTEAINQALYRGQMNSGEQAAVEAGIAASTNPLTRVRNGFYVAAAAPQYQVQQ